jgi:adenylate kinase
MHIVLLGSPGAGKGTQSKVLVEKYGLEHIATGDIFRSEIGKKTTLGQKAENYVKKGMLVPDELVVEMVAARLDAGSGKWLLDGFPRTLGQAQELDKYLTSNSQNIDMVLYLAMPESEVIARLTSRRTCSGCGDVYNLHTRKPQAEGKCDKCGEALIQREDDSEATVNKRLMIYEDLTQPLVAYYRSQHEFQEVDGNRSVDEVTSALCGEIDKVAAAGRGK